MINKIGAKGSPWRTPVLIGKGPVFPSGVMTVVEVFICTILNGSTIAGGIPYKPRRFAPFLCFSTSSILTRAMTVVDDSSNSVKNHPVIDLSRNLGEVNFPVVVAYGHVAFLCDYTIPETPHSSGRTPLNVWM